MAPPTFADLGKSAKDLINKGYSEFRHAFQNFIIVSQTLDSSRLIPPPRLERTRKSNSRLPLPTTSDLESSEETSTSSTRSPNTVCLSKCCLLYNILCTGLTLTEKWNTENQLGTVVEISEQFGRGLKLTFDSVYVPHNAKRSGKLKLDWSHPTARVSFVCVHMHAFWFWLIYMTTFGRVLFYSPILILHVLVIQITNCFSDGLQLSGNYCNTCRSPLMLDLPPPL